MSDTDLRGDCGRCAALCCTLLSFEAGPHFAFDKPAGEGCHHLRGVRCAIHARLGSTGMAGCAAYDCLGAGQLVTAMFAGLDLGGPSTRRAADSAFALVRQIQAMRLALRRTRASDAAGLEQALQATTTSYAALRIADLSGLRARAAQALTKPSGPSPR